MAKPSDTGNQAGRESAFPRRHRPPVSTDDVFDESAEDSGVDTAGGGRTAAAFAGGLALGLALGAGVALLFAPQAGSETRVVLRNKVRRLGHDATDQFDELRHELRAAARRSRRRFRRGVTRGRWAAEDALDRRGLGQRARQRP